MSQRFPDGLLWDNPHHRAAKHAILRLYLAAWFTALDDSDSEVTFIDGSAGPDEHERGEPGSPIVALEVADEHAVTLAGRDVRFLFVEEDAPRAESLSRTLKGRYLPVNFSTTVVAAPFETAIAQHFDVTKDAATGPVAVMLDPFGVGGVPFHAMKLLAAQPRCDLLVICMPETVSRWSETNEQEGGHVDRIFGGPNWRVHDIEGQVDFYRENLQSAGFPHNSRHKLIDQTTKSAYYLIAATHNASGLAAMVGAVAGEGAAEAFLPRNE